MIIEKSYKELEQKSDRSPSMSTLKVIQIGDVKTYPGEKKIGTLKVGETPLSEVRIPFGIVNGIENGPTLCVIGGEHAMEYAGIDAVIRIFKKIKPKKLSGALIVAPVVNTPAFETRTPYVCPIDNVDVARAGLEGGTIGHIIARKLAEEVISKADYLLNLHGGDLPEALYPFVIAELMGDEAIDSVTEKLSMVYGTKYIIHRMSPLARGERPKIRIPYIVGEAGSLGRFDEKDIAVHVNGVMNVMKYLKMIEGDPVIREDQKIVKKTIKIAAKNGGIFYPKAKPGSIVSRGEIIGKIKDIWGKTKNNITAPEEGVILYMFWRHVVNTGDPLFSLGVLET